MPSKASIEDDLLFQEPKYQENYSQGLRKSKYSNRNFKNKNPLKFHTVEDLKNYSNLKKSSNTQSSLLKMVDY